MYLLLKNGAFPASYVSLPEGKIYIYVRIIYIYMPFFRILQVISFHEYLEIALDTHRFMQKPTPKVFELLISEVVFCDFQGAQWGTCDLWVFSYQIKNSSGSFVVVFFGGGIPHLLRSSPTSASSPKNPSIQIKKICLTEMVCFFLGSSPRSSA